ncbi:MAG: SMC-Scp complex subunit ScpB [Acidobacteria bacterium]|nr:SMC-Scp complex subunit ScpB [Acidobacteriota bacterium]
MSELRRILEAVLFVSDSPVPPTVLAQVTETPLDQVIEAIREIASDLESGDRGVVLREVGGGWRMYTHPETAPYVERFVLSVQQPRITQAALETLAIVAYKQPVSRQQIASIRGVDSDGVVQTLLARGLIDEVSRDPGPGQAILYGTSQRFLERLGLRSPEDLPPIAEMVPGPAAANDLEP